MITMAILKSDSEHSGVVLLGGGGPVCLESI